VWQSQIKEPAIPWLEACSWASFRAQGERVEKTIFFSISVSLELELFPSAFTFFFFSVILGLLQKADLLLCSGGEILFRIIAWNFLNQL